MRQLETNFLESQCCVLFYSIPVDKIYFFRSNLNFRYYYVGCVRTCIKETERASGGPFPFPHPIHSRHR